jgi:hypothetical protein
MAKRDTELTVKPRNDAYTGMLIVSLGAMILGSALLYVDYNRYPTSKPADIPKAPMSGKDQANLQPPAVAPKEPVNPPVVPPKEPEAKDKDKAPKDKDEAKDKDKADAKDKDKAKEKDKDK